MKMKRIQGLKIIEKQGVAARIQGFLLVVAALVPLVCGGEIVKGELRESATYPGTTHSYEVWVPDRYDGSRPACLYVGLDGQLCNAVAVMDSLMTVGKMPVTIGVFLQPGVVKDAEGNVLRYNRSNEFDMTDGTFARFIETELLPAVEGTVTADGRRVRLSPDGNDHMIFGLSSGGIAAFTAAWFRPDLFRRVFSGVGTFVTMRGGNDLQMWVRKREPQPLKICLQDGTEDVWNPIFGHWYEGNRMLATALDFAGYQTKYDWSDCNHGVKRASEIMAEVMEWMWQGYPDDIVTGTTQNGLLAEILVPGSRWEQLDKNVWSQYAWSGWHTYYPDSTLRVEHYSPMHGNWLWQSTRLPDGTYGNAQRFYYLHSYDNRPLERGVATAFDAAGYLWVLTSAGIQICDQNGRVRGVIDAPPCDCRLQCSIAIVDGAVVVASPVGIWRRVFHVKAPVPGMTPKSQGQG